MQAPLKALLLILVAAPAHAEISDKNAEKALLIGLAEVAKTRFGRLTDDQKRRYPEAVATLVRAHPARFDAGGVERLLKDLAATPPFMLVAADRDRWDEEFDVEIAITRAMLNVWVEKSGQTDGQKAEIRKQGEALDAVADRMLGAWWKGADSDAFRRLYADLAATAGTSDRDPLSELRRIHREGTATVLSSRFSPAFRRALTPAEMELAARNWEETIRKIAPVDGLDIEIARWLSAIEAALKESDPAKRLQAETDVFDDMFATVQSFRFEIARIVKGLMESAPSDDQKKAVEAMLKRRTKSK